MSSRAKDADRYGDGDVPEVDTEPYKNNQYEPHPQTSGDNQAKDNRKENHLQ